MVFRIMQRTLHPTFPIKRVKAVFSNPSAGGHVFIDAETEEDVKATVKGVSGVWSRQIRSIPRDVFLRLLRVYGNEVPEKGRWVKLRKSRVIPKAYDGQFAWLYNVDSVEDGLFDVVCVPMQGENGEWHSLYNETQVALFKREGRVVQEPSASSGPLSIYQWKNLFSTSDGFAFFPQVDRASIAWEDVTIPDRKTIDSFRQSTLFTEPSLEKWRKQHEEQELKVGNRVIVKDNARIDNGAIIRSISEDWAEVFLPALQASVEIPLTSLRPQFMLGDTVEVVGGTYKGRWGWIVKVSGQEMHLFVPNASNGVCDAEEVSIMRRDITLHAEQ